MKNKKGFTLVELLAVIVILALIMGIAVVSIGGILNSTRQSAMKETAVSIINGVRQQATIANQLYAGDYYFTSALLESGGDTAPLGGKYQFSDLGSSDCTGEDTKIGTTLCRKKTGTTLTCNSGAKSFVRVEGNGPFTYKICLTAGSGQKFIELALESDLLNSNDTTMIKDGSGTAATPGA